MLKFNIVYLPILLKCKVIFCMNAYIWGSFSNESICGVMIKRKIAKSLEFDFLSWLLWLTLNFVPTLNNNLY